MIDVQKRLTIILWPFVKVQLCFRPFEHKRRIRKKIRFVKNFIVKIYLFFYFVRFILSYCLIIKLFTDLSSNKKKKSVGTLSYSVFQIKILSQLCLTE
jgi:hypothetical protein